MSYGANSLLKISLIVFVFSFGFAKTQCPPNFQDVSFNPNKMEYCVGDNIVVTFTSTGMIDFLTWNFTGSANAYLVSTGPFNSVYNVDKIQSAGNIILSGSLQGCNFTLPPIPIQVPPQIYANAGPDLIITGNPNYALIGSSQTASGGAPAYTFAWSPNSNFVNSTNAGSSNPQVNPAGTTNYQVVVTDNNGCQATDDVIVYNAANIPSNKYFAILKKELDASFYNSINSSGTNLLYFKFDEEYFVPASTVLSYKLYNDQGTQITTASVSSLSGGYVIGDNRFSLNVASLSVGYYKLQVYNQKNEMWQARIRVN